MSRFAILAVTASLFCVAGPLPVLAQRGTPTPPKPKSPAVAAPAQPAGKTEPAAVTLMPPGTASIIGAATDSIHGGMLTQATVMVRELPRRQTSTTAIGAFRLDSIPPGRYTLELKHPVIDTIGIRVVSDTITLVAGQVATIEMAVPSAKTVTRAVCAPAKLRFGPSVVLGRVIDAGTQEPAVGAEVSIAWTETQVGTDIGIRSMPRVRKSTVEADGTYRICGVPANFTGSLQANRGTAKTAEVPVEMTDQPLSMRVLYLPPDSSGKGSTRAIVTGKVTNAGGVPVADARISIQGSTSIVSSGADGGFTLTGVPPGTQSVLVRRVGYSPVEIPVDVTQAGPNRLTVRLGKYTAVLSSVDVKAKADPLETTGFESRRKMGMGRYLTLDEIEKTSPSYTSDALRRIPGISVTGSGYTTTVTTTRGNGCVGYLVDGSPMQVSQGQSIDALVNVRDIAAIEYYSTADIPMELSSGLNNGCAEVVIWTKGRLKDTSKDTKK